MKKFILIPDSFKGTLSSERVCELISNKIRVIFPDSDIVSLPVADGGEGTVDCFLTATGGKRVSSVFKNPFCEEISAYYGMISEDTAVIETAQTAGLPLIEDRKNPLKASTVGVGEQIVHAAKRGVKNIIIGLGGSCTNDFGCGAAYASGIRFFDKNGAEFMPVGETLKNICRIDKSGYKLCGIKITAMCDVNNPPYGANGAARIFAPQKGATESEVALLDEGVEHVCDILKRDFGEDYSQLEGGRSGRRVRCRNEGVFRRGIKIGYRNCIGYA